MRANRRQRNTHTEILCTVWLLTLLHVVLAIARRLGDSSTPNDPADYALRSPFPTIHLLRGSDVVKAEVCCNSVHLHTCVCVCVYVCVSE